MAKKIRIYEIAKELGLENKDVLALCLQLEIDGKTSHSNSLTDDEADKIRRSVIRQAVSGNKVVREVEGRDGTVTERRVGNVIRRRKKSEQVEEEVSAAPVEADESSEDSKETESSSDDNTELEATEVKVEAEAVAEEPAAEIPEEPTAINATEDASEEIIAVESASEEAKDELPEAIKASSETEKVSSKDSDQSKGRSAKVLGKIELPAKKVVAPKQAPVAEKSAGKSLPDDKEESSERSGKKRGGVKKLLRENSRLKRRKILGRGDLLDYDGDRDVRRQRRDKKKKSSSKSQVEAAPTKASKLVVKVESDITVSELASRMGVKSAEIIKQLMGLGIMANMNQTIDYDTAALIADEHGYTVENVGETEEEFAAKLKYEDKAEDLELRPPIVTVMGHVDHGKTSLLDVIREASVADKEAGGITQHIGAYKVELENGGAVTFLDTPGHAAFTSMRGRGAKVTDIVVLVVAADDGVMPQTIEAINHAKAAEVPIIVAVNKIDKEGAQPDKIKTQISEHGLVAEDWGGDTIIVPVSAHTKEGVPELLENLSLQSEILELRANPNRRAVATVIESRLDNKRGAVITVLVQNGTLKHGQPFLCGSTYGKVRSLVDDSGNKINSAGPGTPVEILGVSTPPQAGDDFYVMESDSEAKKYAELRQTTQRKSRLSGSQQEGEALTLENFSSKISQGDMKELPIVVKGDVAGSVEAVREALEKLSNVEVVVKVIHTGVGAVTENDVQLASASKALLVGFNVRPDTGGNSALKQEGMEILYSRVIYELVESVEKALKGLLEPVAKEKTLGRVEVRETFNVPKMGTVAGSYVVDGSVKRNANLRLLRDNKVVHEGKISTLRRFKDDVKEVATGYECGVGIEGYTDLQPGDIMEVFIVEMVAPE